MPDIDHLVPQMGRNGSRRKISSLSCAPKPLHNWAFVQTRRTVPVVGLVLLKSTNDREAAQEVCDEATVSKKVDAACVSALRDPQCDRSCVWGRQSARANARLRIQKLWARRLGVFWLPWYRWPAVGGAAT